MKAIRQIFKDVLLIEPTLTRDDRGYILDTYSEDDFNNIKIDGIYVEEKVYIANKISSIFGIYYQEEPYLQNKIISCQKGSIMAYVIDLDKNSNTYKKWICVELDDKSKKQLFIPKQYGYLFLTMENDTHVLVKTDEYQTDGYFKYITYLDDSIGLEFPFDEMISSYKEKQAPVLD